MVFVGQVIGGRFRVDAELGAGGMGIVVAATHLELGHRVAIKLLRDEMAARPPVVERFLREARAVVQLHTEHVCRVLDVGRLDSGAPYIVMELLEGSDLGHAVARAALPMTMAVEYVMQACVALAEAHAAGIVHRDIKPANLFVTRRPGGGPLIKVLDFGIAKALVETGAPLTQTQGAMGSPGYMSPEQLQSARDVDPRTDLWSLGVTLYQLLSARLPFYRPVVTEMAVRIATDQPDPLDVDPALRQTIWRCLEKAPAARFASVTELATALIPFGGPSARGIAALVGRIAAGPGAPLPAPPVSPSAYTVDSVIAPPPGPAMAPYPRPPTAPVMASGARPPTAPVMVPAPGPYPRPPTAPVAPAPGAAMAQYPRPPTASVVPPAAGPAMASVVARPGPRWWLAGLAIAVTVAGAAIVAVAMRGSSSQGVVTRDAAVSPLDAVPHTDVMEVPRVNAPSMDAALDAAGPDASAVDPWASQPAPVDAGVRDAGVRDAAVRDAGPARVHHAPVPSPTRGMPSSYVAQMRQTCQQVVQSQMAASMPPISVAMCWCVLHDVARASAIAASFDASVRANLRAQCAVFGTKLP